MPDNQGMLQSASEKRAILIVDDEAINRALLNEVLKDQYEILFAEDGFDALQKLEENRGRLSLVLLDLMMPNLSGIEVLRRIRANTDYQDIPVIVVSGDQSQEIECLSAGASDFIQKPYPNPGVILARVRRAIELFENRQILESTERDPLTGLYNLEFFYIYSEQFDQRHGDTPMDAIVLDINHFSTINERFGKAYADDVLIRVARRALEMAEGSGGIVCRRESDIFQVYCPHRDDYKALLDNASKGLSDDQSANNRVRLRMGVYANVDKSLDIERRFDRAKMAADTIRGSYTRSIGVYDDTLHKAELYSEQLVEGFQEAIDQKQFKVYFQPKFDIRPDKPVLCGAEGLVRWQHPELGMISPGVFIPLFEHNGLIQALDHYVWREAARQVRVWKDALGYTVPVSVNVSRIDMYDPNIVYTLLNILETYKLEAESLHLEVTESAYAEDAEQIIETVKRLRAIGFQIEMDDFGTGYSSLNMLSTLPIDVLKLDMKFVQTAFSADQDTHMLSVIVEIANHLNAPVVAEGVETIEQLKGLKEIGCAVVQGYYFSPPVPPEKFEAFLTEAKKAEAALAQARENKRSEPRPKKERGAAAHWWSQRMNIPMRWASLAFMLAAFVVATGLYIADSMVTHGYLQMERTNERYLMAQQSVSNLQIGSDYLTDKVRGFVVTGQMEFLEDYFTEAEITRRRDTAVENLQELLEGEGASAKEHLSEALGYSNELMQQEYRAMRYTALSMNYDPATIPDAVTGIKLSAEEQAWSQEELRTQAIELVYGPVYREYKEHIEADTTLCAEELISAAEADRVNSSKSMSTLLTVQTTLTILLLAVVLGIVIYISVWIRKPLTHMVERMKAKETVPQTGAQELRFVAETYNAIFEENRRTHERLTYGNMHDALTGLYNRSAYDFMKNDLDMSRNALLLVDVDKFKTINDTYGHDVGDLVLKRVAEVLKYNFRSTDLVFRLGGDEFVVIMSNVSSIYKDQVVAKIEQANVMLQKPKDDLPPTSLSVGVAFADRENPEGDIFKDADTALYRVKEAGRCGCEIF